MFWGEDDALGTVEFCLEPESGHRRRPVMAAWEYRHLRRVWAGGEPVRNTCMRKLASCTYKCFLTVVSICVFATHEACNIERP